MLTGTGTAPGLSRRLGPVDGAGLVVTNVIGTGIFLTPAFVAQEAPSPVLFLGLWLAGGMLSAIGALCYAELAAMKPEAGGEYVYIRDGFGPVAGFLSGWTSLVAGFSGAIAAASVGFAIYLDRLAPGAGSTRALLRIGPGIDRLTVTVTPRTLVALGLIALFSLVHARGLRPGRLTQQALAWLNVGTILALVVLGFLAAHSGPPGTPPAAGAAVPRVGGLWVALVLVMFTYSGWNAAAYVAGEVRDPGRNLPRSLLGGTVVVIVLYVALNVLYLKILGVAGIAGAEATGDRVAGTLWGSLGVGLFTPLILLVLVSSVSAMTLTGPRVYFAMGRDGCLPTAFARVPARGVPGFSIAVQGIWSAILVLTGGFEALLTYTGFAVVLFAGLGVAALIVLRRRQPTVRRPFRVPGYPVTPLLFVACSAAMVVQAILHAPGPSLSGVALILLGIPVHAWVKRKRR